jgi:hypothetical protein
MPYLTDARNTWAKISDADRAGWISKSVRDVIVLPSMPGQFWPESKTVFDTSHYRPSKYRNGSATLVGVSQAVSVTEYGERLAYCGGATPIVGTSGKGPPEVIERGG